MVLWFYENLADFRQMVREAAKQGRRAKILDRQCGFGWKLLDKAERFTLEHRRGQTRLDPAV
ncbi:hypothetical protein [Novosphingobium taihuense]|uniref:Putative secreted acid phosphatase n=1 Tax=Novosphingobium taihuense TaxID=260085 RepID=A0A7W7ADH7_9SPHN|nr:hypothetical protein [Novosphingobium taihuense]MBB4614250.1 putative secreted acid phosphatase [Novosphingobium taihuense]TWH87097.1 hypothetical protein IQ25_01374 [Novosphingobium taihuense]